MVKKTELKRDVSHFSSINITSYLIYTDLISSLLDPKLVDPRSTLVHTALKVGNTVDSEKVERKSIFD